MAKYNKENKKHIQEIFEEKTGIIINGKKNTAGNTWWKAMPVFALFFAMGLVVVIAYENKKTSGKSSEEISFVKGENIEMHQIDLPQMSGEADGIEIMVYEPELAFSDWMWPTKSRRISAVFDMTGNNRGITHDHINIAGKKGDTICSVSEGTVTEAGYVIDYGNYIVVDYGDGILVKYGHLEEIYVEKGDTVMKGQKIGTMGATGIATGPNLTIGVYKDGMPINPITE